VTATDCFTCEEYLERRLEVLGPHLVAKAEREGTELAEVVKAYTAGAHYRHTVEGLSLLVCHGCGCTPDRACAVGDSGGCSWVEDDLCSACFLIRIRTIRRAMLLYSLAGPEAFEAGQ